MSENDAENDFPDPPIPSEVDLRSWRYMPLVDATLFRSRFYIRATDAEFRAALQLWAAAWREIPAGSLPDDDIVLANLAGYGRAVDKWLEVRDMALEGFVKCRDSRLYHLFLCELVLDAWEKSRGQEKKKERDRERQRMKRAATITKSRGDKSDPSRDVASQEKGIEGNRIEGNKEKREGAPSALALPEKPDLVLEAFSMFKSLTEQMRDRGFRVVVPKELTRDMRSKLKTKLKDIGNDLEVFDRMLRDVAATPYLRGEKNDYKFSLGSFLGGKVWPKVRDREYTRDGEYQDEEADVSVAEIARRVSGSNAKKEGLDNGRATNHVIEARDGGDPPEGAGSVQSAIREEGRRPGGVRGGMVKVGAIDLFGGDSGRDQLD